MGTETKATPSVNDVTPGLNALQGMPVTGPGAPSNSQDLLDSLKNAESALEARYANPNWFNVAAGFAKPQLGGFTASLGSAAQELGNWQEQQRANQIPLFNVRAQVGALQAQRKNREAAAEVYSKWDKGDPADPNSVPRDPKIAGDIKAQVTTLGAPELAAGIDAKLGSNKIVADTGLTASTTQNTDVRTQELLGNTPRAKAELNQMAAQLGLTTQELTNKITENGLTSQQIQEAIARTNLTRAQIPLTQAETSQVKQKTTLEAQNAELDNLFIKAPPGSLPTDWAVNREATRKNITDILVAKGLTTPEAAKGFTDSQLQSAMNGVSSDYIGAKIKNKDTASQIVESTQGDLKDLAVAKDIITSPRMEKLLGIGAGQNAMSAMFGYFANPTDGTASSLNRAAAQLSTADPQAYADFDVLNKTLQRNQLRTRAAMENPSVGSQIQVAKSNPSSFVNSQLAMAKMVDLMAHDTSMLNRNAALRMGWAGDYNDFVSNPKSGYSTLADMGQDEARKIANSPSNIDTKLPDFYYPSRKAPVGTVSIPAPATNTATALPTASKAPAERPFHYEYSPDRTQRRKVYD